MQILPISIEKEITVDDDLSKLIIHSTDIHDGDIIVIAQKIVSKHEGRVVELSTVKPSLLAEGISSQYNKDPHIVELILSESKRIIRMKNGTVELLLDATRKKTLGALERFQRDLKKSDNFLLYYAGHGKLDEEKEGFWQPTDSDEVDSSQWIANKRINSILKKFKANNIILVADSCYAGAQFRGLTAIDQQADDSMTPSQSSESLVQRLSNSRSRVAITSGGLEPVADRIGFSDNSVFATSFITVLENNSEIITSGDFFKRVRQRVVPITAEAGLEQTPEFGQLWSSGHEGGDFIFKRTTR